MAKAVRRPLAAKPKPRRPARQPKPKADRSELTQAEASLTALSDQHSDAQAALKAEADDLAARRREAEAGFTIAKREAQQSVAEARRRYRAAGGR